MALISIRNFWPFIVSGLFFISSCTNSDNRDSYLVIWEDDKAVGVQFSQAIISDGGDELKVHLEGKNQEMLGDWDSEADGVTFRPIVPFSPGKRYVLSDSKSRLVSFSIKVIDSKPPEIIAIYPSVDSIPSNLLKMYIQFSKPMTTGSSLKYITILNQDSGDTLEGTFLNLQPELWNQDYTLLTLWLDPGRIKRGLIPNQELGAPLELDQSYKMIFSHSWEGANGLKLKEEIVKEFHTMSRDESLVNPESWSIRSPKLETTDPLYLQFHEPLDAVLAVESIHILDSQSQIISGNILLGVGEREISFHPDVLWKKGHYIIQLESRLEDLAGNNLYRLFDQEINGSEKVDQEFYELSFYIN